LENNMSEVKQNKKSFRRKIGMVFRVPLGNDKFAYGQMVTLGLYAFFDYQDNGQSTNIGDVLNAKMLFKIIVQIGPLHDGIWSVIGTEPVKEELLIRKNSFKYDRDTKQYVMYEADMKEIPTTEEEIRKQGLEYFAAWGYRLVEDRLRDHFAGRMNYWVERDLHKDDPTFPNIETFYKQQGYDYVWKGNPEKST